MTRGGGAQARGAPEPEPRFTPDQAARALQRAVTLNAERLDRTASDLSLEDLIELGREIGIGEEDVRTAAAVERLGSEPDRGGRLVRAAGPRVAEGHEVVDAPAARVAPLLEEWVRVAHCMKVRAREGGATHWEPAAGLAGSLLRGARSIAGESVLEGIQGITTRVEPVGDGRCVVRVDLDPGSRGKALGRAGVVGGGIAVAGVVGAVALAPLWILAVPVGAATAAGIVATRRRRAAAAEREIQRLMSGVVYGDRPPSALDAMRGRMRRAR
ncbi:MAG: hypothetical protein KDC33_07125 [Thermoleophilia bacterium]|nr:hypothetical protein [Thermoleophilia bacterium]